MKEKETHVEKKNFPIGSEHYELYEEIGQGVSAVVHRAFCKELNEHVAIKILDCDRDNSDLNNISRESQTMMLVDHPNVLKSYCSFVSDQNLWVVMPFMAGGSCLHILKAAYSNGFEENIIATILKEVLKGLDYLHQHGHIHRDVKAGNILIDARGNIKLGDFGVSACLFDSGDRQRMRNTFVGTPCWMAPEVMEQLRGYDCKADIWSFGITALELAHGHAPFSKYPPMKVLLMTLQNAPPGLDYERDRKFSKSFKQMIASCLVKDPSKRPSAKKLLKHSFFKQARSNDYIARSLLEGLPALGDRMKALKRKEEDMLAQKKMPDGEKEELSQNEYKRGISGWNFNLDDMKAQASLIQDFDDPGNDNLMDDGNEVQHRLVSIPSFARMRSGKYDDDSSVTSSSYEHYVSQTPSPRFESHTENNFGEKSDSDNGARCVDNTTAYHQKGLSSGITPEIVIPPTRGEGDKSPKQPNAPSTAATVQPPGDANSEEIDDKTKAPVVQQKGRFKVTSENVDLEKVAPSTGLQKSQSLQVITSQTSLSSPSGLPIPSSDATPSNVSGCSIFAALNAILQTNMVERDHILSLMKQFSSGDAAANCASDGTCGPGRIAALEKSLLEEAHDREKELLDEMTELRWRLIRAQDEIQKLKTDNTQVLDVEAEKRKEMRCNDSRSTDSRGP